MQVKALTLAITLGLFSIAGMADNTAPAAAPAAKPARDAAKDAQPAGIRVDPSMPIARVNGTVLTAMHLAVVRAERAARGQGAQQADDEQLRDALVNAEVMAQEAARLGLDKPIGVQAAMELNRKELLGRALIDNYINKNPITEERIKAEYERLKAKSKATEYRARHILVDDEKTAKDLIAQLDGKKPAKFEDLAKKHSKDSSSANGGDLGWMTPGNLVPEFAEAMTKLAKGDYTKTPVKSKFGWHVIKLENSRPIPFPEYDKVKSRVANQLAQDDVSKYVSDLRAAAKIEVPTITAPAAEPAPAK